MRGEECLEGARGWCGIEDWSKQGKTKAEDEDDEDEDEDQGDEEEEDVDDRSASVFIAKALTFFDNVFGCF